MKLVGMAESVSPVSLILRERQLRNTWAAVAEAMLAVLGEVTCRRKISILSPHLGGAFFSPQNRISNESIHIGD